MLPIMYEKEHIRTWTDRGFRIELYDLHSQQEGSGRNMVEYVLFDDEFDKVKPVIGPIKVPVPLCDAIDSDAVITFCLSWNSDDFLEAEGRIQEWIDTGRIDQIENLHFMMIDTQFSVEYWRKYHETHKDTD